jgi:hypothetical protein
VVISFLQITKLFLTTTNISWSTFLLQVEIQTVSVYRAVSVYFVFFFVLSFRARFGIVDIEHDELKKWYENTKRKAWKLVYLKISAFISMLSPFPDPNSQKKSWRIFVRFCNLFILLCFKDIFDIKQTRVCWICFTCFVAKDNLSPLETAALTILGEWNGTMDISSVGGSIYQLMRSALLRRVLLSRLPSSKNLSLSFCLFKC